MKRRWILMNSPKKTWFAFPYILWIIGFTLIPLGLVLYYAFTGADGSLLWQMFSPLQNLYI